MSSASSPTAAHAREHGRRAITYVAVVIGSLAVDFFVFVIAISLGVMPEAAHGIARVFSATTTFLGSRRLVFRSQDHMLRQAFWFIGLVLANLSLSGLGLWFLHRQAGLPPVTAKAIAHTALFFATYLAQQAIFRSKAPHSAEAAP